MAKKQLIINADDFGWDEGSTSAILGLLRNDLLKSTTIMANFVEDKDLMVLRKIENISTGIHVNLIAGKPVSSISNVSSLVDGNGLFHPAQRLLTLFLSGKVKTSEIEIEVSDQVERLRQSGIKISHADSHQHLHQFPFIGKIILKALNKNGITRVRNCNITAIRSKRAVVIKAFARLTTKNLSPFSTTGGLIPYFSFTGNISGQSFAESIQRSFRKRRCLEIMTHPGTGNRNDSYLNRTSEYNFWKNTNWKQILIDNDIELINYYHL